MLSVLSIWTNGRDQDECFLGQGAQISVSQVAGLNIYRLISQIYKLQSATFAATPDDET